MSTDQAIMNDFTSLLKENRELKDRLREAERQRDDAVDWIRGYIHDYGWPSSLSANTKLRAFISNATKP